MDDNARDDASRRQDAEITVMVIDDDPMICQALSIILTDSSAGKLRIVATLQDGQSALDEAARMQPDVILMDIAMPGMDGIETTRRLRRLEHPPHVLMLTSLSPANTVSLAVEAGAEGFVSKTDDPKTIVNRVIGVCRGDPQFNPASERQLIKELNAEHPRSR